MGSLSLCLCLVSILLLDVSWSISSSVPPSIPSSDHLCLPNHRDALLQFKNAISISDFCGFNSYEYPRTESWSKNIDCCSWEGVKCDNLTGNVIGLDLSHSCLNDSLVANNSLFHLDHLRWLDLSFNYLRSGSLLERTSNLFHFHGLQRLNLADNYFDSTISTEFFSQLVSLTHLNLSRNYFSAGFVPYQISLLSSLVSLDLSTYDNLIFDGQDFDMFAKNLTKLTNLVLDGINMSDVSVTSFLSLTSSLETLSLVGCELDGEFPSQVFQLPNLKHLKLGENENLRGYLPKTNWSSALELLDLSHCGFRGSIPGSFGNLTQIISLSLSENFLEGQIPDFFGNLSQLTSLRLSSCNLSGPLPTSMFNLTQITFLDLSHNHLEGPFPNQATELQFLEELYLSNNSLSGGVPSWLLTLPSLLHLDLSLNKLAGPLDRIRKPSYVQVVDLSSNNIHGPIPDSIFNLVNLSQLHLSSNNLSGPIPDSIFDVVNLSQLRLSSNNLSGVVRSDLLSKLTSLEVLDVSNNSLLSLSTSTSTSASGNYVNYSFSFPQLQRVLFNSCSVRKFPSFFRTSKLKVLDLSNNMISGGISKWEAQGWEELRVLNLSYNFLTTLERIPGRYLQVLDLRSNLLEGPILSTMEQESLSVFLISENKLTGNIPSSICNSTLFLLDLSDNNLSGTIPECLGNFSAGIEFMGLQMNNFYGKIPHSFCNSDIGFNWLSYLYLNDNQFEGLVPPSMANCTYLRILNLGNNKLTDRFPHWLASLPYLRVLILKSNRFHGSLPHSRTSSNFSALQILDLSSNEFSGTLPRILFQNLRAMTVVPEETSSYLTISIPRSGSIEMDYYQLSLNVTTKRLVLKLTKTVNIFVSMDLSSNQFYGQIPEEVGGLISLQMLNFSHNNFTGPIPESFGNFVAVESLDLSSNKLSGRIPSQMTNLTFLAVLNLSENDLVGPIPHGKQFDTFDNDSYIGNLGLCDLPLSKKCVDHGGAEPPAPLLVEHDEGSALPFFWKVVMMGYGSGVVVGVSLAYIVFMTGRPWWFVRMVERDWQPNFTRWIRRNKAKGN